MRLMLYLILFILGIMLVRSFIRNFRSASRSNNNRNGFTPRSKYENVEEADFKEIESPQKKNKEE